MITAAADGLARVWDVREACLKRYGRVIGSRPEYQLQPIDNEPTVGESCTSSPENAHVNHDTADIVPAPPIPIRAEGAVNVDDIVALPGPPNPPLNQLPAGAPNPHNNDDTYVVNGQFIANDFIDKGVKLVSKLQHGATLDDRLGGPGTRARRSAVNVICVAICPYGGHFATGSDDGICRVWQEDDNSAVERIDARNDIGPTESMHSRPSRSKFCQL